MNHTHHDGSHLNPGFMELWSPGYMLLTLAVIVGYLFVTGRMRDRFEGAEPVPRSKKVSFLTGMLFFYLAMGSPLAYYGHSYLFSAHMLQQSLLYLMMPPLILIGTPAWFFHRVFQNEKLKNFWLGFTNPIFALFLFNGLFSVYHMPTVFDFATSNMALHMLYHAVLLLTAFQMWWNITCPVPEMERISHVRKMGYIFANGVLLTPACGLIIFAAEPMYATYVNAPQLFFLLPTLDDQQLGGVLMKFIQEIAYGTALWYVFIGWFRKENPDNKVDEIVPLESGFQPVASQHR